jgi:hypothetical protein
MKSDTQAAVEMQAAKHKLFDGLPHSRSAEETGEVRGK